MKSLMSSLSFHICQWNMVFHIHWKQLETWTRRSQPPLPHLRQSTPVEEDREDENGSAAESEADEDDQGQEIPIVSDESVPTAIKTLSQYFMQKTWLMIF
ncbi:hypothetical protein PoB_004851200 [Plakobranchus ocellatus]|uniref:Uncharacterized protein n=1 Tax=Plakobranchus ocellatus TaxID=259542 RepID=A0AAV4BSP8_9GAST|nr:hypothetical protein PoB_004851200 [Plakobranchus ocellatus]